MLDLVENFGHCPLIFNFFSIKIPLILGKRPVVNQEDPQRAESQDKPKKSNLEPQKTPSVSHENEVYPKTQAAMPIYSNSPVTLSLSFSCLILAFILHH